MTQAFDSDPTYPGDRYRALARTMREEARQQRKSSVRDVYEDYAHDLERWARYVEDQVRRYA